jgi:hypothetical protein
MLSPLDARDLTAATAALAIETLRGMGEPAAALLAETLVQCRTRFGLATAFVEC